MKTLLKKLFINNWERKLVAIILGMITWMIVNHSMTVTKTFSDIPVKIINIPPGKTIEGLQRNNILTKRISLTLSGNKSILDDLSSSDLEVIIDAIDKGNEWVAKVNKKNLVSFNPDIDINKGIKKVSHNDFIVKLSKIVTERIPILITKPIGQPPKGYQFLDVWPYQLYITISGPENIVKQLKSKGLKLTFNLSDIKKTDLTRLQKEKNTEEISFTVPNSWKKIVLPYISYSAIEIDDPQAKNLRIDFSKTSLIPLNQPIPVHIFFPPKFASTLNPMTYSVAENDFIYLKNDIYLITTPLYAQGVSRLFVDIIKDMIELVIVASPKTERDNLLWDIQFIYRSELENRYVAKVISETLESQTGMIQPHLQEEYLRNRFRSYMESFRLYTPNNQKLSLNFEIERNKIYIQPSVDIKKVESTK
jgi:YbbR domain-containing protein